MKTGTISAFMLERYKLGELDPEDQAMVTEALAADSGLRERLAQLDASDRELRLRYPPERVRLSRRRFVRARAMRLVGLAALVTAGILLPVLYIARNNSALKPDIGIAVAAVPHELQTDRTKGLIPDSAELLIYLKGEQETGLPNQAMLEAGNTVQLAYTVPAGTEYYGVIFSVDGRAAVTMHYPYRRGQNSRATALVSGRRTFLSEAYILDDAPDYEIFVMVVSDKPLDADVILREAQTIVEEKKSAAFEGCEVETITILKKTAK